jgi:hypothetical protein
VGYFHRFDPRPARAYVALEPTGLAGAGSMKRRRARGGQETTMKQVKHWQDPVNAVCGAWLILSPWALGFAGTPPAMWNFVVAGVLLVATALGAIFLPRIWEEWTETVIGLWVVVSPWVVGFATSESAKANAILSGLVILTLSLWTLQDEGGWLAPDKTA